MSQIPVVLSLFVMLFMPVYASAQTPDRITILENFGNYDYCEPLFIIDKLQMFWMTLF